MSLYNSLIRGRQNASQKNKIVHTPSMMQPANKEFTFPGQEVQPDISTTTTTTTYYYDCNQPAIAASTEIPIPSTSAEAISKPIVKSITASLLFWFAITLLTISVLLSWTWIFGLLFFVPALLLLLVNICLHWKSKENRAKRYATASLVTFVTCLLFGICFYLIALMLIIVLPSIASYTTYIG